MKQSKLTHLMASLVPGLGKRKLHFFFQLWRDRKIILRAGTELKFENYESVQHRLQFSGIKKEAKISFHRHFNTYSICNTTLNTYPTYNTTLNNYSTYNTIQYKTKHYNTYTIYHAKLTLQRYANATLKTMK